MVTQNPKVERHPDELTRQQMNDIRDLIRVGFTVEQVGKWFTVDAAQLQKRLDNFPRQRMLFVEEIGGAA